MILVKEVGGNEGGRGSPPPKKKLYDGLGGQIEVNWKLLKCESGEGWRK